MKYAIPLGAILLIGIASGLHRPPIRPALPKGSSTVREVLPPPPVHRAEEEKRTQPLGGPLPDRMSPASSPSAVSVAGWKKLFGTLDRGVVLTSPQLPVLEQVLQDRESEIRAYHLSLRKSGVLDLQEFGWMTDRMKESWYRRIDALLDAAQHERFLVLVEKGFLNDGLELTIEPGMMVLD